jgi:flagellum-specific ATP synthase
MESVSRLAPKLCTPEHMNATRKLREAMAVYAESKDLIELGAYTPGTNPALDAAVRMQPEITAFLRQDTQVSAPFPDALDRLKAIAERL